MSAVQISEEGKNTRF